jgi:hypothetical protein
MYARRSGGMKNKCSYFVRSVALNAREHSPIEIPESRLFSLSMICAQTRFAFVAWKTGFHFSGSCSRHRGDFDRHPDAGERYAMMSGVI